MTDFPYYPVEGMYDRGPLLRANEAFTDALNHSPQGQEPWETYAPTFDKMGAFEIIDMKRFVK